MSRSPRPSSASPISSSPRSTATICPTAAPAQFVKVIEALRRNTPSTTIEILTPDFRNKARGRGREDHRGAARRLQPQSGDGAAALSDDPARRALLCLAAPAGEREAARSRRSSPSPGVMVGLGEQRLEVHQVMDDMRSADVDFLTMGQYLQPTPRHATVEEFVTPQAFSGLCRDRPRQGLPARRRQPADPLQLSCRRRFREDARGPRGEAGGGALGLMPRHTETRILPYTPEQMFDLVADVGRYQEFLPWVAATRIRSDSETEMVADLVVGFSALKETFTSRVHKHRPARDRDRLCRGPAQISAQQLEVPRRAGRRTEVDFCVDFAFRNRHLRGAGRADVRPRAAADDRRVRGARRRALRRAAAPAAAARARKAPPEGGRRRGRDRRTLWCRRRSPWDRRRARRGRRRRCRPACGPSRRPGRRCR